MVKALLVSLLVMFSVHLGAQSSPYFMEREIFVQLPEAEQNKIIVGFMQFMVEMDAMYPKEVRTSDFEYKRKEILRQFVLHFNTAQEFMLTTAHAQDVTNEDPFADYRKKFEATMLKIENTPGKNMCIYGGWISSTDQNGICIHPSKGKPNSYVLPAGMKLGPQDIACNPLIFGYENPEKKTLFKAVATSSSINSSLDCMQQSQGVKKDKNGITLVDNFKDDRMKQLKDAYLSKTYSGQYNAMTKFIHQTCLCNDGSNHMNPKYLSRIQPHRTCFSLLNQYRNLRANGCSSNLMDLGLNVDNIQNIFESNIAKMQKDLDDLKIKPESVLSKEDKNRLTLLDAGFKDLLGDEDNQKKFCEAQKSGVQTCKVLSCTQGDKSAVSCDIEIFGSKSPNAKRKVTMVNGSVVIKDMIPKALLKPQDVTCSMATPTCAVEACKDGSCAIKIAGGSVIDKADENLKFEDDKPKMIKVKPDGLDDKSVFTVACAAPPKEPKCEVLPCKVDPTTGEKTCEFTVPGFALKEPTVTSFKVAKDAKDNFVSIALENEKSVQCEAKDAEKKSSCDMTIVENKDDKTKVDVSLILTLLEGDGPTAPAFDPTITATTDDKQLEYKATVDLASLGENKTITASKFSKNFPDEKCVGTLSKDDSEPQIKLTKEAPKKNDAGVFIILIKAEITITTIDKSGLKWEGGKETSDKAPDQREVEQTDKEQVICAKHDEVPSTDPKGTCITVEAKTPVDEAKATLSLSGTNRSNQNFDVKAAVTRPGSDFSVILSEGYTLVWFTKNKPELTPEEKIIQDQKDQAKKDAEKKVADKDKDNKKKVTGAGGDSVTEDDTKDTKPKVEKPTPAKDVKPVEGEVQSGTALTYSAPIGTAKYDICANLMKDGKVEATGCKPVPGYMPPAQQQMGPPPVPGAYRYRRW